MRPVNLTAAKELLENYLDAAQDGQLVLQRTRLRSHRCSLPPDTFSLPLTKLSSGKGAMLTNYFSQNGWSNYEPLNVCMLTSTLAGAVYKVRTHVRFSVRSPNFTFVVSTLAVQISQLLGNSAPPSFARLCRSFKSHAMRCSPGRLHSMNF